MARVARVLSFNIEYGAQGYPLDKALQVIRDSRADIVVVSEAKTEAGEDSSSKLAADLGWNHVSVESNGSAVIGRWPLRLVEGFDAVVEVKREGQPSFYVISAHLTDFPYQPFQAKAIPYCYETCQRPITTSEGIARAATRARGEAANRIAKTARKLARRGPVIVAGDFNEPSHLDWTTRAATAGLCPAKVVFPVSRRFHDAGLVDAFRVVHPDELKEPGITWPANEPGYEHRADRIDFIYVTKGHRVQSCEVLSSPSDHHAVLAVLDLQQDSRRGATLGGALVGVLTDWPRIALLLAAVVLIVILVILLVRRKRRNARDATTLSVSQTMPKTYISNPRGIASRTETRYASRAMTK